MKSSGTRRLDNCSKHNAYAVVVTYTPKSMHSQSQKKTYTLTLQCPYLFTTNQQPNSTAMHCLHQKLHNLQNNKDNKKQLQIHWSSPSLAHLSQRTQFPINHKIPLNPNPKIASITIISKGLVSPFFSRKFISFAFCFLSLS